MLEINNVVKNYGSIEALKGVDLKIEKGEFFGLLGPNGAGKTTLLNIIIGYLTPDEGTVSVNNEVLVYENLDIKKQFGYVPQEVALYQDLTAYRNLEIFGSLYGLKGSELKHRINEILEIVQLEHRKNEKVKNFSGGMKRRLNIAASILHNPQFLLCDEPTVGVDPQSRNSIFDLLQELNKEGKTILYTTHYMEEAERLCSKLAIIDNGEIIALGNLNELLAMIEKKVTVLIDKNELTVACRDSLQSIGELKENDFYFMLIPSENFNRNSLLFSELERLKIPDEFVSLKKASLEDVFFQLTGRKLRD